ncbi:SCO family protein [Acidisoma sp. 7E03]
MIQLLRRLGFLFAILLALGCGTLLLLRNTHPQWFAPLWQKVAGLGLPLSGQLSLVNAKTGAPFTSANLQGGWSLVYFGYTFCPDVCSADLTKAVQAIAMMETEAPGLTPIFITVDPVRDTPAVMARYVALFSPRLLGLTGSVTAIAEAERMFRVYASKQTLPNGGGAYLMNHSTFFYLVNPAGRVTALLSPELTAPALAKALSRVLAHG